MGSLGPAGVLMAIWGAALAGSVAGWLSRWEEGLSRGGGQRDCLGGQLTSTAAMQERRWWTGSGGLHFSDDSAAIQLGRTSEGRLQGWHYKAGEGCDLYYQCEYIFSFINNRKSRHSQSLQIHQLEFFLTERQTQTNITFEVALHNMSPITLPDAAVRHKWYTLVFYCISTLHFLHCNEIINAMHASDWMHGMRQTGASPTTGVTTTRRIRS